MDWTTIAATVDYADILAFMASVVAATFTVRVALKGVGIAQEIGAHGGLLALRIDHHAGVEQVGPEVGRRGPAGQHTQRGNQGQNSRKKRTR